MTGEKRNQVASALDMLQENVTKTIAIIRTEAERLEAASNAATGGAVMSVHPCKLPDDASRGIAAFGATYGTWGHTPHWTTSVKLARSALEQMRADLEKQHEAN